MSTATDNLSTATELRCQAEERLCGKEAELQPPRTEEATQARAQHFRYWICSIQPEAKMI